MVYTRDLTEGKISSHLFRLTTPLIFGNILQQLYNAVDAFILGRYAGEAEFAAIGIAGSVMNLFLFAIVGACTGMSVLFAQFYGADDLAAFRREHALTLFFGLLCTAAGGGIGIICLPWLLRVIQTPQDLTVFVSTYLIIILASLPAAYLYNLYGAVLRSIGQAGVALAALTMATGTNLLLDILFVSRFGMGIAGAAWATAISQALSGVLCILWLCHSAPALLFHTEDMHMDRDLLRRIAHFSFVTGLHQSSLYIGKLLVQGAVNTGGTEIISAYTATTRIEGFANSFGDSGASAASVLVAQNLGAGRKDRTRQTFHTSLVLMLILGLVSGLVMYLTSDETVGFMLGNSSGAAYENGRHYMRTVALFYVFCFTGNAFAGYFDGCGRVTIPFIGAVGHITLRVVLSWWLIGDMGLNAVATATGTGWILVNLFWSIVFFCSNRRETQSR